jgi:hypothetical protein
MPTLPVFCRKKYSTAEKQWKKITAQQKCTTYIAAA